MNKKKTDNSGFAYITIGLQLAITVLLFVFAGYKLDVHLNKSPLFVSIGAFMGMIIGFYHLMKSIKTLDEKVNEKDDDRNRPNKWL